MPAYKKMKIGILIDGVNSEYHKKFLSGIIDFFNGFPVDLFCFPAGRLKTTDILEREKNILFEFASERNMDGLIVLTDPLQSIVGKEKFYRFLNRYGEIPIISISVRLGDHYSVLIDNKSGMESLLDHLTTKHNFKRIALVTGPQGYIGSKEDVNNYIGYFKLHNLSLDRALILSDSSIGISGRSAVKTLIDKRHASFDCIIAGNDEMVLGVIEELSSRGIQVPGDSYVTGFGDIASGGRLSLTMVRQPVYEQGRKASEILYSALTGKNPEKICILPAPLIVRETCGCRLKRLMNIAVWKGGLSIQAEDFEENFTIAREKVINDIISGWPVEKYFELKTEFFPWLESLCLYLVDAFRTSNVNKITDTWGRLIFHSFSRKMDLAFLNEIISGFRRNALRCHLEADKIIFLEDIFHKMRIMAEDMDNKETIYRETLSLFEFGRFSSVSASLAEATNMKDLIDDFYDILGKVEIKTYFFSLYKNPSKPLGFSMLIFALDNKRRHVLPETGLKYKTKDLLPDKVYPNKRQNLFIVQLLHQKNERIGFVIMDMGDYIDKVTIYDELNLKVSSTVRLIMLIDKILKQAHSLEEEVRERKRAEKKLKSAMTKLEKYNEILHDLSLKDDLTGLYNRRGFNTLGGQHLNYARRNNKSFVLFYFDMDGLKKINDSYGHKEGDYAIKKTAQLLQKSFRSIDIIARIGGDEFTVLAIDCGLAIAEKLKKRVKVLFENFNALSKKGYRLSISSGIIHMDGTSTLEFGELMALADKKLYEEKNNAD